MEYTSHPGDLTRRVCEALANGDAAFFKRLNGSRVMLGIGETPQRWWPDYAKLIEAFLLPPGVTQQYNEGVMSREAHDDPSVSHPPTA